MGHTGGQVTQAGHTGRSHRWVTQAGRSCATPNHEQYRVKQVSAGTDLNFRITVKWIIGKAPEEEPDGRPIQELTGTYVDLLKGQFWNSSLMCPHHKSRISPGSLSNTVALPTRPASGGPGPSPDGTVPSSNLAAPVISEIGKPKLLSRTRTE